MKLYFNRVRKVEAAVVAAVRRVRSVALISIQLRKSKSRTLANVSSPNLFYIRHNNQCFISNAVVDLGTYRDQVFSFVKVVVFFLIDIKFNILKKFRLPGKTSLFIIQCCNSNIYFKRCYFSTQFQCWNVALIVFLFNLDIFGSV